MKKILLNIRGRYFFKKKTSEYFKQILKEYIVDIVDNVEVFNDKEFFNYDTTIFFTQFGEFTEEQEKNVLEFVANGKGFVGIHGATASFKEHPKYFEMIGGRFISHKKKTEMDVKIIDKDHFITQGLEDFKFYDEPYRHDYSTKGDMKVLAEADYNDPADPETECLLWVKTYGEGRVAFCALGHQVKSLQNEIFRTIIIRLVKWVLKEN